MRRAACCWITKRRPGWALETTPLGSPVREKSRIERYFESLDAARTLMASCGVSGAFRVPSIRGSSRMYRADHRHHLVGRQRIEHVALADPRAPRHRHREPHGVEGARRVRIARQHELDAAPGRLASVHRIEIEAVRVAVDL